MPSDKAAVFVEDVLNGKYSRKRRGGGFVGGIADRLGDERRIRRQTQAAQIDVIGLRIGCCGGDKGGQQFNGIESVV